MLMIFKVDTKSLCIKENICQVHPKYSFKRFSYLTVEIFTSSLANCLFLIIIIFFYKRSSDCMMFYHPAECVSFETSVTPFLLFINQSQILPLAKFPKFSTLASANFKFLLLIYLLEHSHPSSPQLAAETARPLSELQATRGITRFSPKWLSLTRRCLNKRGVEMEL